MTRCVIVSVLGIGLSAVGAPVCAIADYSQEATSFQVTSSGSDRPLFHAFSGGVPVSMVSEEYSEQYVEEPASDPELSLGMLQESRSLEFNLNEVDHGSVSDLALDQSVNSDEAGLRTKITDIGVALAQSFTLAFKHLGSDVELSLLPKIQRLATYHYKIDETQSDNDYLDQDELSVANGVNLDADAKIHVEDWLVGVRANNLVARELDTRPAEGGAYTYYLQPQLNVMSRYELELVSVVARVELLDHSGFDGTAMPRYGHLGLELGSAKPVQLHLGLNHDLNDQVGNSWVTDVSFQPVNNMTVHITGEYYSQSAVGGNFKLAYNF